MFVTLRKDYLGHKAGATLDIAEDEVAKSLTSQGIADAVQGDPYGPLMAKAMEASAAAMSRNMEAVITQALKQFADAQGKSRKNAVPAIFGDGGEGDPKKSFGDYLLAVARGDRGYLEKHYASHFNAWQQKAALGEASGVTGGYTVPVEFYQQLMTVVAEETFIRPAAMIVPMGSATMMFPYLDITTVQAAGTSPFFGAVNMAWTEEAQTRTETEPKFKQMELKAHELSGYTVSSNVLLQDSVIGLEKFLFGLFAKAIGWYEEYAFLQGNGVGKPIGMINCGARLLQTRATSGHVNFADIAGMWAKLLPISWNKAFWAFSPSVVPDLLQLKDGANRAIFLQIGSPTQGAITTKPNWQLLGRPAIPTEKLPALGTLGDICLIDPSFYVVGDRQQIEIAASEHVNFLKNQMTWRVVERVDGQPWMDSAVTLQDASTQVSPFVVLNT